MPKVKTIKKIGENVPQKCIRVKNEDGLFVLANGLVTHNSPEYILRLYNDGVSRVDSRMHGNYYGRTILDSSPNSLTNPIDDWVVNEARKNSLSMVIEGSMWKWDPDTYSKEFENNNTFKVYTGGKGQPPRLLEPDDPLLKSNSVDPTKIIDVPSSMKQFFIDDLPKALKDRAGIPSGASDNIITDYAIIENMFDNNLRNIYTSITAPSNLSPQHLIWDKIKDTFFKKKANDYEYYYLPKIPRVISVDQSYATDITSIAMSHIERLGDTGDNMYVVDFTIVITPTSEGINLEAIRCFIEDLKYIGHLNISGISFDQFQSETTIQNLKRNGFEVEKLSVDSSTGPYLDMLSLMNRNQIKVGKNIFLKNNLKCLHMTSTKSGKAKIDHDASRTQVTSGDESWDKSFIGYFGKDVSDSVAASIALCSSKFTIPQVNWKGGPLEISSNELFDKVKAKVKTMEMLESFGLK